MSLWRDGAFVDDDVVRVGADEPLPASGRIVLTKARLIAEREALAGRNAPYGVALASGETLEGIEEDLARLSLVVLDIPRYADGRLYSVARLLRERHGYAGEIRAAGDVLRDQIMFLHRVGVDSFDVTHPGTIAALREGAIVAPRRHMQVAAREGEEEKPVAADGTRPWRRITPRGAAPGAPS